MEKSAAQYQQEIDQLTAQLQAVQTDYAILTLLQGQKTAIDHLSPVVRSKTLVEIVKSQLAKNKAEFVPGSNGYPELKKIDGSNFYSDSNILFTNETFIEDVLTKNNLVGAVAQNTNGLPANSHNTQQAQQAQHTEHRPKRQNMLSALAQDALNNLEQSEKNRATI